MNVVKLFLTLPVTNCSTKSGFSIRSKVTNLERATLMYNKLNSFGLMYSEKDIKQKN